MTRLQILLLQVAVVLVCWAGFRWYYIGVGEGRCEAKHAVAQMKSNKEMYDGQIKRDARSDTIVKQSTDKAEKDQAKIEEHVEAAKSVTEVVYRDRWHTAPVGKCSHPLDPRVQSEIDQAVQRTNEE